MRTQPGWPRALPPPETQDWDGLAVAWLLDLAPGDWRGLPAVAKQPLVLALLVADHVAATRSGMRASVAGLRSKVGGVLSAPQAEAAVAALLGEEARLERVAREVGLVIVAIEGTQRRPASRPGT